MRRITQTGLRLHGTAIVFVIIPLGSAFFVIFPIFQR